VHPREFSREFQKIALVLLLVLLVAGDGGLDLVHKSIGGAGISCSRGVARQGICSRDVGGRTSRQYPLSAYYFIMSRAIS
jgi:hypothetical protein